MLKSSLMCLRGARSRYWGEPQPQSVDAAMMERAPIMGSGRFHFAVWSARKGDWKLEQSFTDLTHTGCITALASTEKYLASGSSDEAIKISNLITRTDVGSLVQHDGSVRCLTFYENSYLFSGSDDSNVCIWKVNKWQCEKTLRGHKKSVSGISIHPSGKLALTTSADKSLRTWNLIKGRSAYIKNIHAACRGVEWSPSGKYYSVRTDNVIDVYDVKTASIKHSLKFEKSIHCCKFLTDEVIIFGGEHEEVHVHDILQECEITKFRAHSNRTKAIANLPCLAPDSDPCETTFATCSNDGFIKIWSFNTKTSEHKMLTEVNTTCRNTCLTVSVRQPSPENGVTEPKKKRTLGTVDDTYGKKKKK